MRILHISTRLILGGSQENTILSCEGQAQLCHDVHLAFGPIFGPEGSMLNRVNTFKTDTGSHITTHQIPHLVRQITPVQDHRAKIELLQLINQIKPDIVHTHSSKAGILGRIAAWNASKKLPPSRRPAIIHTIHGPPFMPIEGSPTRRAIIATKNAIYAAAEKHAAKRCHLIVSVADAMTEQFLARNIGKPAQYTTVRSGMTTEPFLAMDSPVARAKARQTLGLTPENFVIGTIARLAQHKGHDDLLDAACADLQKDRNIKLLWVGDGWFKDRLMQRVRDMGLMDSIVLTGLVDPDRVPEMIAAMDVLAHPSYREGLPRTVPQALLCKVPVVACDADGTREICIDMQTGRLVPVGDVPALQRALRWMLDHPREKAQLAARGQALCRQAFDTKTMVENLERVYEKALQLAR